MFGGGLVATLEHLSGNLARSGFLRWLALNLHRILYGWLVLIVLIFAVSVYSDYERQRAEIYREYRTYPAPEWARAKIDFRISVREAFSNVLWFNGTILFIVPAFLILPGVILWVVLAAGLTFVLLALGPFILLSSGRALFFHYAARALAHADQREREEKAVRAAWGMGDSAERSIDGKARLMGPGEFARFSDKQRRGAETVVGTVGGNPFIYPTEKHVLIVAGTRGGKGRDLIIPNLKVYPGPVFVLDPKGENAQQTLEQRQIFGPVAVLDPFGVSGFRSAYFNPLRLLKGDSAITDAQTLADALIMGDDHFSNSSRQLLVGLILYTVTEKSLSIPGDESPVGADLVTVRRLLMRDLQVTLDNMIKSKAAVPSVRELICDIGAWGLATAEEEWSGIKNSAIEQTKWMNSPEMCRILEGGTAVNQVDFSDYLNGVMSVYVCLPAPYFATFNRWLRLVVASALDTMTKRLAPPPLPVRFVLDEVAQLGNLSKIESALTLSAGYGVQLWGIWQHISDIQRCYPNSGIGGWVSSSGLRLVFAVQDNETIRYFAQSTGEAMTEADIRQLEPGKILCLTDGANPLLVDRLPVAPLVQSGNA